MTKTISNSDDVIDSRDVIARIDELEDERQGLSDTLEEARTSLQEAQEKLDGWEGADESEELLASRNEASKTFDDSRNDLDEWDEDNGDELKSLKALAEEGESATSEWPHGEILIRESYWVEYCEELVKDIGDMPKEIPSYIEIDWDKTADNIKADYSEVDYDGVTYLIRS
jgi:hypothetical protein